MTKHTQHVTDTPAHVALDQCRVAFMAAITSNYLRLLMEHESLPNGMNRNILHQTLSQLERCIREVRRTAIPHEPHYLDRNLKHAKLMDLATAIDAMARIGIEENPEHYEEFFGLMIDCIDGVFYAQQNRKKLHFGKYKALFQLFSDEIKADINGEGGQLVYTNRRELMVRLVKPESKHEIR